MSEERDCDTCQHEDIDIDGYPCDRCSMHINSYWMAKLKSRGINITMSCGEKHHVDTDQSTIESVTLNDEQIYPIKEKSDKIFEKVAQIIKYITDNEDFARWFNTTLVLDKHEHKWIENGVVHHTYPSDMYTCVNTPLHIKTHMLLLRRWYSDDTLDVAFKIILTQNGYKCKWL